MDTLITTPRTELMTILTNLGFCVGTTESFYGREQEQGRGIWVRGEGETEEARIMWFAQHRQDLDCGDTSPNTIEAKLETLGVDGWFVEWHDYGTMMLHPIN